MLMALIEGLVLFGILLVPTLILCGIAHIIIKKEDGKKQ